VAFRRLEGRIAADTLPSALVAGAAERRLLGAVRQDVFEKVLLAVDGSDHSAKAVAVAADIARKSNGEVVVFHALEYVVGRGGGWELESDADAERLVDPVRTDLASAGVRARSQTDRALAGRAPQAILDAAGAEGADQIVMGSRGRSDLAGLLLGSVAHKVIQLGHCPVLVAR
jgi:nucleotide-binding universal stress UspA family protein